jgi:hypothetical protein
MLKRFWESLIRAANTCSGWKIVSQSSSAKLKVFGSSPEQRRLARRMTASINCKVIFNSECR